MREKLRRLYALCTAAPGHDLPRGSPLAAAALRAVRVLVLAGRSFVSNRRIVHATALAYTTLLSLVPLLALALAIAKGFGMQNQIRPAIEKWLAANQEQVGEKLMGFIEQTQRYVQETKVGLLGGVGLLLLLWATIKVMGTIEKSFNEIWRVRRSRPLARKLADYISVLVVSPALLVAATSLGAALRGSAVLRSALAVGPVAWLIQAALVLVPTWAAFAAAYAFLPNTKVRLLPALAGGIAGGTAWQLAFWGYTTFQVGMARYNAIYGALAALPVLMVWLYIGWAIVLFGAEVSWAAQHGAEHWAEQQATAASFAAKQAAALRTMAVVAAAFQGSGRPLDAEQVARRAGLPLALAHDAIAALADAGICSTPAGPRGRCVQPARPLEQITPADVLAALRERGGRVQLGRAGAVAAVADELLAAEHAALRRDLAAPTFREIAQRLAADPPDRNA